VDKILKGEKPADLPIDQSSRFEFEVNLTAKILGVEIPTASPLKWLNRLRCRLLAQRGHAAVVALCPLLGAERKTYAPTELFSF
jgi:hypothetical protein